MFSRLRMSPIVEIQGSDWNWLRLIVASGTARYMRWKCRGGKVILTAGAGGLSYQRTVQDRRQLPPLDSASSLVNKDKKNPPQPTLRTKCKCCCFQDLQYSSALTIRVRVGHFFVCHHSCCCIVHLFKATELVITDFHIHYPHIQDGPKASSKPRRLNANS